MGRLRFSILMVVLATGLLSGCATTGSQRVYRDATSLERLAEALDEGRDSLNATLAALTHLMVAEPGAGEDAAEAFSDALRKLDKKADRVIARADQLDRSAAREFRQWEVEMASSRGAEIDGMSEGRRETVTERFEAIKVELGRTREAFDPLMAELRAVDAAIREKGDDAADPVAVAEARFPEVNRLSAEVSARLAATMDAVFEAERLWSGR